MTIRPGWARNYSDEAYAIVARRRARHDVLRLCAVWTPEGMALATFWHLATGCRFRGRRVRERRTRGGGDYYLTHPEQDRRGYEDRRMP